MTTARRVASRVAVSAMGATLARIARVPARRGENITDKMQCKRCLTASWPVGAPGASRLFQRCTRSATIADHIHRSGRGKRMTDPLIIDVYQGDGAKDW